MDSVGFVVALGASAPGNKQCLMGHFGSDSSARPRSCVVERGSRVARTATSCCSLAPSFVEVGIWHVVADCHYTGDWKRSVSALLSFAGEPKNCPRFVDNRRHIVRYPSNVLLVLADPFRPTPTSKAPTQAQIKQKSFGTGQALKARPFVIMRQSVADGEGFHFIVPQIVSARLREWKNYYLNIC